MKRTSGWTGSRLEINLTPLLDLVLQLIMFFMLTVNFLRVDQISERVDLPVVQSAMPLHSGGEDLVYINITADGQWLAGGNLLPNGDQLRNYVQKRKEYFDRLVRLSGSDGRGGLVIVVRAHKDASWGTVWDTLDLCNRAGYHRWQLRVLKKSV
jgi:biopolymer transport protein ExbD